MSCLQACGFCPSAKITGKITQPWQTRYDIATRISLFAICLLGFIGIVLMALGFNQSVHPMAGVGVLCSILVPISFICSLRSHGGPQLLAIYS